MEEDTGFEYLVFGLLFTKEHFHSLIHYCAAKCVNDVSSY